jgi:hypothetical protein
MSEKLYKLNGVPVVGTLKEVIERAIATRTVWTASIVSHQLERVAEIGSDGVVWVRYDYCKSLPEELRDESA